MIPDAIACATCGHYVERTLASPDRKRAATCAYCDGTSLHVVDIPTARAWWTRRTAARRAHLMHWAATIDSAAIRLA